MPEPHLPVAWRGKLASARAAAERDGRLVLRRRFPASEWALETAVIEDRKGGKL